MTDDQAPVDDAGPINLADIRSARTIAQRIADVESQLAELPAAAADAGTNPDPDSIAALSARLDSQRADIDALKQRYNDMVGYLQQQLGGTV